MKVVIFGASGMVGQAAMRACLLDPGVDAVLAVGRSRSGQDHAKLRELVIPDLTSYVSVEGELAGWDACFFCLGVTSAGISEAEYTRITHDIAVAAATTLARLNPQMTFVFVSGAGTDEHGKSMWARVKGRTENDIFALPFKASYAFRPGVIRPLHGIRSRTRGYRIGYAIARPLMPVLSLFPGLATTTDHIGRAMLAVARRGHDKRVLESRDINASGAA